MKKQKLIVATALVLVLAMSLTLFVGCDEIFKKNDKRDAEQVVASVTYEGEFGTQKENVYKFELASSFNAYAYYYVNYYGMTYEAAANYLAQSLAQQKLLVLFAKEKVAKLEGKNSLPASIDELLSAAERNKAIEDTNKSLLDSLVSTVESLITEDNANTTTSDTKKDTTETKVTDPVYVRFESNGGSTVEKQKIQKGSVATEPDDPTKSGYTFYGWYADENFTGEEFDFENTAVNETMTLYAKWVEYVSPRTALPEVAEEDDYDPDSTEDVKLADKFFSAEYKAQLLDDTKEDSLFTTEFLEADFVDNIVVDGNKTLVSVLKDYINEGLSEMETNLKNNLYKDNVEDCYNYYLNSQHQSLLVARLKRMIGNSATVTEQEVKEEFEAQVAKNKETFASSDSSYESALTSTLNKTYYHPQADQGYGFVINILFKLDSEGMKTLNAMAKNDPTNVEAILLTRNRLIADMTAYVSNPKYDSTAVVEDADGKKIELRDPMTDAKNPYNNVGGNQDTTYQVEGGNNYNQIVEFKKVDDKYQIVYNATEHPAMAYLSDKVSVFDKDGQIGLIHQIHNSLNQVKTAVEANEITKEEGVYWLREVATTWAYLVSDDPGATSSDSNNNGLGYLVSPEGKDSSFLADFTDYARSLITAGTGSFANGDVTTDMFNGTLTADGQFAGDKKAFVIADSLVSDGKASASDSAYAGVFVLLNSYTVWDANNVSSDTEKKGDVLGSMSDNTLPSNYVMTFAKKSSDAKTLYDVIYDTILDAKKNDLYNSEVNTMVAEKKDGIEYFDKVIKQLYKDLT